MRDFTVAIEFWPCWTAPWQYQQFSNFSMFTDTKSKYPPKIGKFHVDLFRVSTSDANEATQNAISPVVVKEGSHDAISCTQLVSNSMIRKLSLWFQHNSTKESYDTDGIV